MDDPEWSRIVNVECKWSFFTDKMHTWKCHCISGLINSFTFLLLLQKDICTFWILDFQLFLLLQDKSSQNYPTLNIRNVYCNHNRVPLTIYCVIWKVTSLCVYGDRLHPSSSFSITYSPPYQSCSMGCTHHPTHVPHACDYHKGLDKFLAFRSRK